MERTLCVWCPTWSLRRPDAPRDEPCLALGEDGRVIAVNDLAAVQGVQIGMRRGEAEGICPVVVTILSDPGADALRFEPVVAAVEALIPRVEIAAPGLLFVPVSGAVGYYGGERPLADSVVEEVETLAGNGFRYGLAVGPFLAHRAAESAAGVPPILIVEDDAAFLSALDIGTVDREELVATFRWLGLSTLGDLARLPREAVVSRFGADGMAAHRLAMGEDRSITPRALPPDLLCQERFSPPLDDLEQASFAARALANQLIESLRSHGVAPHRVHVEAEAADGTVRSRTWRSADPFDDAVLADRIRWQLRAWIEGAGSGIRGGLRALRLEPGDLSGSGRQMTLHEDAKSTAQTHRALVEVQAIVGVDALLKAEPQGGRDPLERVSWYRWDEEPSQPQRDPDAPWPGRLPSPSPALVPPEPQALSVEWDAGTPTRVRLASRWEPVLTWAGPWRHLGRWWTSEGSEKGAVDRYQLVTSAGAFLCEVREGDTWLVGIYD